MHTINILLGILCRPESNEVSILLNNQDFVNPRTVSFGSRLQDHSVRHRHKQSQVAGLDSQDRKEFPIQRRYQNRECEM
jgi:hypothetical protein